MSVLLFAAICMVITFLLMINRLDLLKFLGYAGTVDIVFSFMMLALFANTFSGVVAASCAGVLMTVTLEVLRRVLGYKRMERRGLKFVWVYYTGKWTVS